MELADVAVIIGRFQVDRLHPGHLELLLWACKNHKKVVVFLGVSPVLTRENPLDFNSRFYMLENLDLNITILPLTDCPTDTEWSTNLDRNIASITNFSQSVILYGARDSFISHYDGHFKTQELIGSQIFWSGTEVRKSISRAGRTSEDFRAGVIWSTQNKYPQTFPTVDAVILRKNKWLLVRKPNEDKFRFVGGFADPNSPSYEDDVIREVKEEVNLDVKNPRYLFSLIINDWRYRGIDKIKSSVFFITSNTGDVKLGDDLEGGDFKWLIRNKINKNMLMEVHHPLWDKAQDIL